MDRREPTEGAPQPTQRRISWISALLVWVVISISGWLVIGGLISVLTPEQASQTATEEPTEDLKNFAPAAGPSTRPSD